MLLKLEGDGPLYLRVYATLRREIVNGHFLPGKRLPGTRSIAKALGVSRTVVLLAYSQLESEGYTTTRVGSGTYVAEVLPASGLPDARAQAIARSARDTGAATREADEPQPPRVPLSRLVSRMPCAPQTDRPGELPDDVDGMIDLTDRAVFYDLQGLKSWRQALSRAMEELPTDLPGAAGALPLRETMLEYLRRERGVVADVEDVIIVHNIDQARSLIARVLLDEHVCVGLEDPCCPKLRGIFAAAGARVVECPFDSGGFDVERHAGALEKVRAICVSPSCQSPTGVVMSRARRAALLEWARTRPTYIVEEDFDCHHRRDVRVVPALQGEDRHGRVVYYLAGFARAVYPALDVSCLVVPPALREKFHALKNLSDHDGVVLHQHAWAGHVAGGEYDRGLRRLSRRLSRKHGLLVEALHRHLETDLVVQGGAARDTIVLHLPALDADWLTLLREEALRAGLLLRSAREWYGHPPPHAVLMLCYAAASEDRLDVAARRLGQALRATLRNVAGAQSRCRARTA